MVLQSDHCLSTSHPGPSTVGYQTEPPDSTFSVNSVIEHAVKTSYTFVMSATETRFQNRLAINDTIGSRQQIQLG